MFTLEDFQERKELHLWRLLECPARSCYKSCPKYDLYVQHCREIERLHYDQFKAVVVATENRSNSLLYGSGKALKKLAKRTLKRAISSKPIIFGNLALVPKPKKNVRTKVRAPANIYCSNYNEFFINLAKNNKEKQTFPAK